MTRPLLRSPLAILLILGAVFAAGLLAGHYRAVDRARRWWSPAPAESHGFLRDAGSWHQAKAVQSGAAKDIDSSELANLPYLRGSREAEEAPVVSGYDPELSHFGVNLVVSGHAPEALLVDMKGEVLHTWRKPIEEVWPGPLGFEEFDVHKTFWRRAHLLDNGDLLAVFEGIGMIKLDKSSKLLWANKGRFHHDLWVGEDGRIFALARQRRTEHPEVAVDGSMLEDFLVVLSADGTEQRRVSILDCFLHSDYAPMLSRLKWRGDVFHTNAVEVLGGEHAERLPMFAAGRVLVSVPTLEAVAVLDLDRERVVWALSGMWRFQHEPTLLPNGNLMVFDNLGNGGNSRVIELDPRTQEVVWDYRGTPEAPLSSPMLGACARLPNGNTLITESTTGRALEVTPDRQVVWEFVSPFRGGDHDELIASLFEVVRIDLARLAAAFPELAAAEGSTSAEREGKVDVGDVDALLERLGSGKQGGAGEGGK